MSMMYCNRHYNVWQRSGSCGQNKCEAMISEPWQFHTCILSPHDDVIKWKFFCVTALLCGEFTGPRLIPLTKGPSIWTLMFLWCGSTLTVKQAVECPVFWDGTWRSYDAIVMSGIYTCNLWFVSSWFYYQLLVDACELFYSNTDIY